MSDVRTFAERGFPYTVFPTGWFQVAWSGELAAGDVMPLRFFDTDLVLYRSAAGEPVMLDAICPHLGAHMGFNGMVEGSCLRCPYHHWRWAADGSLNAVPYSQRTPRASVRSWPVRDSAGIIFAWHDHEGAPPSWDPPIVAEDDDPRFHRPFPHGVHREPLRTHPQFAADNFPDLVHMQTVHEWIDIPVPDLIDLSGPVARNSVIGRIATPRGPVEFRSDGFAYGVGINVQRVTGAVNACTIGGFTPIDQTRSMGFASIWVEKSDPDEAQPHGFGAALIRANVKQLFGPDHDRPVFENARYLTRPTLVPEEMELHRAFRTWSRQFYAADPSLAGMTMDNAAG
jgi:nitrite reductase/ring-hydroxylating ferredoxin subunit